MCRAFPSPACGRSGGGSGLLLSGEKEPHPYRPQRSLAARRSDLPRKRRGRNPAAGIQHHNTRRPPNLRRRPTFVPRKTSLPSSPLARRTARPAVGLLKSAPVRADRDFARLAKTARSARDMDPARARANLAGASLLSLPFRVAVRPGEKTRHPDPPFRPVMLALRSKILFSNLDPADFTQS